MSTQAIAMPSLDTGNRIELPHQPAPFGAPAPEIGPVLQVASDVDKDGYGTEKEFGPTPLGRRIGLAICVAILAFGVGWFIAMLAFGGKAGTPVTLLALALTAGPTYWYWYAAGKHTRFGSCVYLGANGFTRIQVGRVDTTTTHMLRDDMAFTTAHAHGYISGRYQWTSEAVTFYNADGSLAATLIGQYTDPHRPGAHAQLVRTAIKMMTFRKLAGAQQTLASGGQIVFQIADVTTRGFDIAGLKPTGAAIVVENRVVSYFKAPNTQPLVVDRSAIRLGLRQGYVDLTMRSTGMVIGSFKREEVVNFELLEALLA